MNVTEGLNGSEFFTLENGCAVDMYERQIAILAAVQYEPTAGPRGWRYLTFDSSQELLQSADADGCAVLRGHPIKIGFVVYRVSGEGGTQKDLHVPLPSFRDMGQPDRLEAIHATLLRPVNSALPDSTKQTLETVVKLLEK